MRVRRCCCGWRARAGRPPRGRVGWARRRKRWCCGGRTTGGRWRCWAAARGDAPRRASFRNACPSTSGETARGGLLVRSRGSGGGHGGRGHRAEGVTAYIKGASCSRNERRCRCAALLGKLTDCVGAMIAMTGCLWTPACARGRFFRLIVLPTVCTSVWGLGCLSFAAAHHPLLTGCRAGCALRQSRLTSRLPPRCCSPPTRCWCGDGGACGLFSRGTRPFGGRPPRRPCRPPRMVTASGGAWPRPRRHRLRTVLGRLPNLGARAGVKTAGILLCKEAAA